MDERLRVLEGSTNIENIGFIMCNICGLKFKKITAEHLKKHSTTLKEYSEKYPKAILTCRNSCWKASRKLKGLPKSEETIAKMKEAQKGEKSVHFGKHHSEETKKRISMSLSRHDITKQKVITTLQEIVNNNKNIKKRQAWTTISKKLKCSWSPVWKTFGSKKPFSIDDIFKEANIPIPVTKKQIRWKEKEQLGLELCKELYGEGISKPYYRGIGYPDYIPTNSSRPIIEIKSTLRDIREEQILRYLRIKDTKVMVFDNKGNPPIESNRIIYMQQLIKNLPGDKSIVFQQKWERIKREIDDNQQSIGDF